MAKRFLTTTEEEDLRKAFDGLGCTRKDLAHKLGVHPATMRGYLTRGIRVEDDMLKSIWSELHSKLEQRESEHQDGLREVEHLRRKMGTNQTPREPNS